MSVAKFETGEGFRPIRERRNPSSVADFVRATFSHKGRREEVRPRRLAESARRPIRQLAILCEKRLCYGHDG
jgi:hypothetical protein